MFGSASLTWFVLTMHVNAILFYIFLIFLAGRLRVVVTMGGFFHNLAGKKTKRVCSELMLLVTLDANLSRPQYRSDVSV